MSSHAKRRRTSSSTYVYINSDINQDLPRTLTPKRASYQSPTKASLARSNPELLQDTARAKYNRESEPNRRQSLRDAVLGNKNFPSREGSQQSPAPNHDLNPTNTDLRSSVQESQLGNGSTLDGANKVVTPEAQTHEERDQQPLTSRTRQSSTPRRNGTFNFISPPMIPKLVDSPRRNGRRENSPSPEVELPPTPVQLGRGQTDRPRGLVSSSPGGHGRLRNGTRNGSIYTSPLKLRDVAPVISESEEILSDVEIASGLGDEDQEEPSTPLAQKDGRELVSSAALEMEGQVAGPDVSLVEDVQPVNNDSNIRQTRAKLEGLQNQLNSLKQDLERLQSFRSSLSRTRVPNLDSLEPDFKLLLESAHLDAPTTTLPTDKHALFQKHPIPYLTLCSPTDIVMSYQTWDTTISGSAKFVYQTTIVASQPWPANTLAFTLDTTMDWKSDQVENVAIVNDNKRQPELSRWIQKRLQDPLLKHDLATLVTGIGRFFEATTKRAQVWKSLIEPLGLTNSNDATMHKTTRAKLSKEEIVSLLPYINTQQHTFTPVGSEQRTRRSLGATKQLMLTYDIHMDWLGRVKTEIDILTTGFSASTTEAAAKLFREVRDAGGVTVALKQVRKILGMDESVDANEKMKTKKGKARRMTAFE